MLRVTNFIISFKKFYYADNVQGTDLVLKYGNEIIKALPLFTLKLRTDDALPDSVTIDGEKNARPKMPILVKELKFTLRLN